MTQRELDTLLQLEFWPKDWPPAVLLPGAGEPFWDRPWAKNLSPKLRNCSRAALTIAWLQLTFTAAITPCCRDKKVSSFRYLRKRVWFAWVGFRGDLTQPERSVRSADSSFFKQCETVGVASKSRHSARGSLEYREKRNDRHAREPTQIRMFVFL